MLCVTHCLDPCCVHTNFSQQFLQPISLIPLCFKLFCNSFITYQLHLNLLQHLFTTVFITHQVDSSAFCNNICTTPQHISSISLFLYSLEPISSPLLRTGFLQQFSQQSVTCMLFPFINVWNITIHQSIHPSIVTTVFTIVFTTVLSMHVLIFQKTFYNSFHNSQFHPCFILLIATANSMHVLIFHNTFLQHLSQQLSPSLF